MFERWMCSAIKRVKGQTRSCPLKCRWNANPSSVYHFLHSTPTTFNDEWAQLKSREQELGSLVCSLGRPHYKNCYRHLARPPPPSFWVSHPIWWIALLINTAVKIAMPFILCLSLKAFSHPLHFTLPVKLIDINGEKSLKPGTTWKPLWWPPVVQQQPGRRVEWDEMVEEKSRRDGGDPCCAVCRTFSGIAPIRFDCVVPLLPAGRAPFPLSTAYK